MKTVIPLVLIFSLCSSFTFFFPNPPSQKKIQIAILFDTSSSMNGLIEQAKATIWQIVNAASKLENAGEQPQLEIAIYDYGNSTITNEKFVRLKTNLISDLDSISEQLFSLTTNGGEEYCAQVIESAMNELAWSSGPDDLHLIYIAGNEPFNQGKVDYKEVLAKAASNNIIVNTIYCGNYQQGVREFWYDGSLIAQGNYFNIDANRNVPDIPTPYDSTINNLNNGLNGTYLNFGSKGIERAEKQSKEDYNASSKGATTNADRVISKSSKNYFNYQWDLVDATTQDSTILSKIKKEDLPDSLKNKTPEELKIIVDAKRKEREAIQQQVSELAVKRSEYIAEERKKLAEAGKEADLGTVIVESLNTSAQKKGYSVQK